MVTRYAAVRVPSPNGSRGFLSFWRPRANANATQHPSPTTNEKVINGGVRRGYIQGGVARHQLRTTENILLAKWMSTPVHIVPVAITK